MSLPDSDSNTRPAGQADNTTVPGGSSDATIVGPGLAAQQPPVEPPPPPAGPPPAGPAHGPDYSLPIMIGVFVIALVGIGLLGLGIYAVMKMNSSPAVAQLANTATAVPLPTQLAVSVPTTTPRPVASDTPTAAPTTTELPATPTSETPVTGTATITGAATITASQVATATEAGNVVTVNLGANVRTGPGIVYPAIGAIKAGDTAPVIGRDAFGGWFAISFSGGFAGQGWISSAVVTYNGDKSQLSVIAAPPPPAPTATPKPAGNPNGGLVTSPHGVSGMLNLCSGQVTFGVGQRVCFVEWIKNNTSKPVSYGILGVTAVRQGGGTQFQTSWSGQLAPQGRLWIDPGCTGPTDRCKGQWEDGMRLNTPGAYQLFLTVCFSDFPICRGTSGDWESLSGAINITVQ
jgi:uncharacterized protein YraI